MIAADGDEVRIGGEGCAKCLPVGGVPRVAKLVQDPACDFLDVRSAHASLSIAIRVAVRYPRLRAWRRTDTVRA